MNAYLHCLSHTPLVGYVDPEQAVLDEVNGTIADARARIAAALEVISTAYLASCLRRRAELLLAHLDE